MQERMSITQVAQQLEVTPKTIVRWEKAGKVKRAKRDWRGWRFYTSEDLKNLRGFKEAIFYYSEDEGGRDDA